MKCDDVTEALKLYRRSGHGEEDYYNVKEVDRKLSYFLVQPRSIVLDVGSGRGIDTFPLAIKGRLCVNLDTNINLLKIGKKLAKRNRALGAKMEFVAASATDLPFRTCSIDLVTCFSVLDHLPTLKYVQSSLEEFSRVVEENGHVSITFPNQLFIIGTLVMKIKKLTGGPFERRFAPQQMRKMIIKSGLCLIAFDSKYPTVVGETFLRNNTPNLVSKIPKGVIEAFFRVAEKLFLETEQRKWLRIYGARFGYLCQRGTPNSCKP